MNRRGHSETLVAKQPGNTNALKSGVFSADALAPRVHEIEAAMADRTIEEVQTDIRRREIAALAALGEAMDADLARNGLTNRTGEPRRMIELRCRLNKHLMRTLESVSTPEGLPPVAKSPAPSEADAAAPGSFVEALAELHGLSQDERFTLESFDPERFLVAVVVTDDPRTRYEDRRRARRLLTKRRNAQSPYCTCIATLRARDAIEFLEWVAEIRAAGVEPSSVDRHLAARVRALARGDMEAAGGYQVVRRSMAAFETVLAAAKGEHRRHEPVVLQLDEKRFWNTLISRSPRTSAKHRLDAFEALDEIGILARCHCEPAKENEIIEFRADALAAYWIRMVAETHYRAALVVAEFPETYLAVRDSIDAALLADTDDRPAAGTAAAVGD